MTELIHRPLTRDICDRDRARCAFRIRIEQRLQPAKHHDETTSREAICYGRRLPGDPLITSEVKHPRIEVEANQCQICGDRTKHVVQRDVLLAHGYMILHCMENSSTTCLPYVT